MVRPRKATPATPATPSPRSRAWSVPGVVRAELVRRADPYAAVRPEDVGPGGGHFAPRLRRLALRALRGLDPEGNAGGSVVDDATTGSPLLCGPHGHRAAVAAAERFLAPVHSWQSPVSSASAASQSPSSQPSQSPSSQPSQSPPTESRPTTPPPAPGTDLATASTATATATGSGTEPAEEAAEERPRPTTVVGAAAHTNTTTAPPKRKDQQPQPQAEQRSGSSQR